MHERRVIVELPQSTLAPQRISLSAANQKHLLTVLRLAEGDSVQAVDKVNHRAYCCQLLRNGDRWELEVLKTAPELTGLSCISSLCFALCKGDTNDLVIQKAVELGVQNIILWKADRSIPQLQNAEHKVQRWCRIIEESAKQCGLTTIPALHLKHSISDLELFFQAQGPATLLCCSLQEGACPVSELEAPQRKFHILVGPEGDFSSEELSKIKTLGALPLSLGPTRLRSETAAIAAVAMVLGRWGYASTEQLGPSR